MVMMVNIHERKAARRRREFSGSASFLNSNPILTYTGIAAPFLSLPPLSPFLSPTSSTQMFSGFNDNPILTYTGIAAKGRMLLSLSILILTIQGAKFCIICDFRLSLILDFCVFV
jgi:hypothetical protein